MLKKYGHGVPMVNRDWERHAHACPLQSGHGQA